MPFLLHGHIAKALRGHTWLRDCGHAAHPPGRALKHRQLRRIRLEDAPLHGPQTGPVLGSQRRLGRRQARGRRAACLSGQDGVLRGAVRPEDAPRRCQPYSICGCPSMEPHAPCPATHPRGDLRTQADLGLFHCSAWHGRCHGCWSARLGRPSGCLSHHP